MAMPTTSSGSTPASFTAAGTAVRSTSRQSSGSCSAHEEPSRSPVSGSVRSITALRVVGDGRAELGAVAGPHHHGAPGQRPEVHPHHVLLGHVPPDVSVHICEVNPSRKRASQSRRALARARIRTPRRASSSCANASDPSALCSAGKSSGSVSRASMPAPRGHDLAALRSRRWWPPASPRCGRSRSPAASPTASRASGSPVAARLCRPSSSQAVRFGVTAGPLIGTCSAHGCRRSASW